MKKIAFFVEGQTERIFIEKLIEEYLPVQDYDIIAYQLLGDRLKLIRKQRKTDNTQYYFLIIDIHNDGKVLSDVMERAAGLFNNGYERIIGIRDLYPHRKEDKDRIVNLINNELNKIGKYRDDIHIILAVMEIEAWFLCDNGLFDRMNNLLTSAYILKKLGINISEPDTEKYEHPAVIMDSILQLIHQKYRKKEKEVRNITSHLDYTKLICDTSIRNRNKSFAAFLNLFEEIAK